MDSIEMIRVDNVILPTGEERTVYLRLSEIEYAYKNDDSKVVLSMRSGTQFILNGSGMYEGFPAEVSSIYFLEYLITKDSGTG